MAAEKNFENGVKRWFHSMGIYPAGQREDKMIVPQVGWYLKVWGGGFQKSGIPDILICIGGVFIGCEVKAPDGRPSHLQIQNLKQIDRSGGYGVLLYPDHWLLFQNFILCILAADRENTAYNYDMLKSRWKHFEDKIKKGEF